MLDIFFPFQTTKELARQYRERYEEANAVKVYGQCSNTSNFEVHNLEFDARKIQ